MPAVGNIRIVISEKRTVSGFVPREDVKQTEKAKGRVRAVVAQLLKDNAALLFRGEILTSVNPALVPGDWLSATGQADLQGLGSRRDQILANHVDCASNAE